MRLARSFKRRHSCTRMLFHIFPALNGVITLQSVFSNRLICALAPSINQPDSVGTHTVFPFFFLDRPESKEMSQWIPVILLSHFEAAGSRAGKLSIEPKSGKGFHPSDLFKCGTGCRKSLRKTYRQKSKSDSGETSCLIFSYKQKCLVKTYLKMQNRKLFIFPYFIFHWAWDHFGAPRWTNQMEFYLRSGIQRLRQDLESTLLCHVSDFNSLTAASLLQSTAGKKASFKPADIWDQKGWISEIDSKTKH